MAMFSHIQLHLAIFDKIRTGLSFRPHLPYAYHVQRQNKGVGKELQSIGVNYCLAYISKTEIHFMCLLCVSCPENVVW